MGNTLRKPAKAITSAISPTCASSSLTIRTGGSANLWIRFFKKLSLHSKQSRPRALLADGTALRTRRFGPEDLRMTILCLCREEHHWKLVPGYANVFLRRGIYFFFVDDSIPFDASLREVLRACPNPPSAIFHFESAHPLFPIGLGRSEIPTMCFAPDTYALTERRLRWSAFFDHVAVFHPGYEDQFARAGHPGAFLLPHAVRKEFFDGPEATREFEIGWIGQTSGGFYKARAEWLPKLAKEFHTNDWSRSYTVEEGANVYTRSRVVVNIGHDT